MHAEYDREAVSERAVLPSCRAGTHCGDMRSTAAPCQGGGDATTCASVRHPSVSMTKWTDYRLSIVVVCGGGVLQIDMTQSESYQAAAHKWRSWLSPAADRLFRADGVAERDRGVTVTATGSPLFLPGSQRGDRCRAATASAARAASSYAVASMPSRLPSGSTVKRTVTSPCRRSRSRSSGMLYFSVSHCSSAACPSAANRGGSSYSPSALQTPVFP